MEKRGGIWRESRFAAMIMAIMIIAGSFLGAGRSLNKLRIKTEQAFYNGVNGDGFCIQRDIDERIISATNYITLARRYLPESDAALKALAGARDDLAGAKTVSSKYGANARLSAAAANVTAALKKAAVSEKDAAYITSIPADMQSRNDTMSRDGYNEAALAYNEALGAFPANIFAFLMNIGKAELFR